MDNSTITAIATPTGRGGIGVIRISGKDSLHIGLKIFQPSKTIKIESHKVYYGNVIDESGNIIDEVLFIYMQAPRSYTAEDVVEIQSHSSPIVLKNILDLILYNGADLAESGEFTKRAFLNGRIDLTQAEAVIDIINARTKISLDMALSQIKGELKEKISEVIFELQELQKNIEAVVDFPEDVADVIDESKFEKSISENVINKLEVLKQNFDDSNIFRDGIKIVISGPPNSGKSSLMNKLINKDKSIVTSIPGTTRDTIEELINIDGIPFLITDTAGIHNTDDYVEKIGIKKAHENISKADLLIVLFEKNNKISEEQIEGIKNIVNNNKDKNIIVVQNKTDLEDNINIDIKIDAKISVLHNKGIDELKKLITDKITEESPDNRDTIVPNRRHNNLIIKTIDNCERIVEGLKTEITYDLIAIDVNEALDCLYTIIGENKKIDVLDGIFNSFCIGK